MFQVLSHKSRDEYTKTGCNRSVEENDNKEDRSLAFKLLTSVLVFVIELNR